MENEGSISCIAVGDILRKRLEEYTDALSSGVDSSTLARMEDDIDKIEAVHNKCIEGGNITDVDTSSIGVDDAEEEDIAGDYIDGDYLDEEDGN